MPPSRMVTSSRRAGRVTNKTRLLIYRGSDKIDDTAETIVWDDNGSNAEPSKAQHVGAKGVESGELLEHHLQAALSSASLLHSRPQTSNSASKPSSPASHRGSHKSAQETEKSSTLNYHIPTPDATGLVAVTDYAELYGTLNYTEPVRYIKFSDTVEESSGGLGGLGYCMDDEDVEWLLLFNSKAEGSSGIGGDGSLSSPATNGHANGNGQTSQGRPMRVKGKEREKPETPAPLFISEDVFEFVMGVLEKHVEDHFPALHTDLSLLPPFASIESLFSSPLPPSFFPSNESAKGLPDTKTLTRIARCIHPHWKSRREKRQGKSIMPLLNYDETNDGDPYVCFRRRDIRATRKTRRTDNFSVEKLQKVQYEMKKASDIAMMVIRREQEKVKLYRSEEEVWRAKWHFFEIKRRWPSLGTTREEEEIITGRPIGGLAPSNIPSHLQSTPQIRKKASDRERDDREKREQAIAAARAAGRGIPTGSDRSTAPEALKERMQNLQQKLEDEIAKRKELDSQWDDFTDNSFQPFSSLHSAHAFRSVTALDTRYNDDTDSEDDEVVKFGRPVRPSAFRLRRGRGGVVRFDRRPPVFARRRGTAPLDVNGYHDWLFDDSSTKRPSERTRPKTIDPNSSDEEDITDHKRRRITELSRYGVDRGGGLGIGMGLTEDDDRIIVDDFDPKYIRHRINLLQEMDFEKLKPDTSPLTQIYASFDIPPEKPPTPVFIRPQLPNNPQIMQAAQYQQQMLQQQQMAQFQQFQIMAQQQALMAQQAQQQAQAQQNQVQQTPNGQIQQTPTQQRMPSNDGSANGNGVNVANGQQQQQIQMQGQQIPQGMLPPNGIPNQNGRPGVVKRPSQNGMPPPNQTRPSVSPTNALHPAPPNGQVQNLGQSPQMMNGMMLPNGKGGYIQGANGQQFDPAMQQRILAARALANQAQMPNAAAFQAAAMALPPDINLESLTPEQQAEYAKLAQAAGMGGNIQAYIEARNRAKLIKMATAAQEHQANQLQMRQAQAAAAQAQAGQEGANGVVNGNGNGNGSVNVNVNGVNGNHQSPSFSPALPSGQLQLKLPAHAAARLGANGQQQQTQQPTQQRA